MTASDLYKTPRNIDRAAAGGEPGAEAQQVPAPVDDEQEPEAIAAPAEETEGAPQRVIRLFVSSTFRDMQQEREELVKRVFPRLRKLCEERGVTWGEVDLRWGVTDEQKAEGQVLPICLAEIRRCRPYFIGVLGERYGWVPEEIPQDLIEQEPWLAEHGDRSVTELEIAHGVLNDPDDPGHAFFYLRDPAYVESRAELREAASPDEIAGLGPEEAEARAVARKRKLEALKQRILASGLPVRNNYPNPKALGDLVLRDLTAAIDRLFPEGSTPDPLDREAAEHDAFAAPRRGVYIGRREYFQALDDHAAGNGPPLVVLGDSGLGKSALLANWAVRYRASHPDQLLVVHFIGGSPQSTDWAAMLRRLMGELGRRFGIEGEIPDRPDQLREAFAGWLHMAAARGRAVLVLDGLNQLEDRDGAPDLVWLPPVVPANVRLVMSTLPGRPLEEVGNRGWPTLSVQPLDVPERLDLIKEYLGRYGKELGPAHADRIASAPQAENPLFLRAVLEELRLWGDHLTLGARIDHYLSAESIGGLYRRILERYEVDYEEERPGLVRDTMSLLWAARRGLSEAELLDLVGSDGEPLPSAYWSPLFLAAEQSLVHHSGLIGFFHDYFREAVRDRYLPTEEEREAAHLRLAHYFRDRKHSPRGLDELPWQLAEARSWQPLNDLLGELPFLGRAWEADQFEVKAHWARVEANSSLRLVDAYRPVLEDPARHSADHIWMVARLLNDAGHPSEALGLWDHLADHFGEIGDQRMAARCLGNQAVILQSRGDLDRAMALHQETERLFRDLGDGAGLADALGMQAGILQMKGELDRAMALHQEEERISRELGERLKLSRSLGNQASILQAQGDLDRAMELLGQMQRICRELGNRAGLAASLVNQASILYDRGDLDGAMALLQEQEGISRELGDKAVLQVSLGNQARILRQRGEVDRAMALLEEQERISRGLGARAETARSVADQAVILQASGENPDQAMTLHQEQERLSRDLGKKAELARSLVGQAMILHGRGDLDQALALFREAEQICRELDDREGLEISLRRQAAILSGQVMTLQARDDLDGTMALLEAQEPVYRELGDQAGLATCLGNQGLLLLRLGRREEGVSRLDEAHRLAVAHGLVDFAQQVEGALRSWSDS